MSRQGARIAWFIALSAAIHAAVLLTGNRSETRIGPAGRTVHVSMNYRADVAGPPAPAVNPAARERTSRDQPHVTTNRPSPVRAARKEVSRRHDHTPHETTATQPVTTRQAENTPSHEQSSPAAAGMETARQPPSNSTTASCGWSPAASTIPFWLAAKAGRASSNSRCTSSRTAGSQDCT